MVSWAIPLGAGRERIATRRAVESCFGLFCQGLGGRNGSILMLLMKLLARVSRFFAHIGQH